MQATGGSPKATGKGKGTPSQGGNTGATQLRNLLQQQTEFQQQRFAAEQPFNDIALQRAQFGASFLPQVGEAVRNPTANPYYDLAAREGLTQIRNNYSVTGSPSSGPGQLAGGRFIAGLQADQVNRMYDRLFGVAGIGQPSPVLPPSQALMFSNVLGNTAGDLARTASANYATRAGGGVLDTGGGDIASGALAALGYLWSSEKFKEDIKPVGKEAHKQMLDGLLKIPVYTWKYKDGIQDSDYHVGTITEKSPKSIVTKDGMALDPVSYFGMLTLGYQDLQKKVKKLEAQNG